MIKKVLYILIAITLITFILPRLNTTSGKPEESFLSYSSAGVFGPRSGREQINGDVHLTHPGVRLQNINISGNLYIGKDVTDGRIHLDNVSVSGAVVILAGGETVLTLNDSTLTGLSTGRTDGKIQINARGKTTVDSARIQADTELTEESLTADGFVSVFLNGPGPAYLNGDFYRVEITAAKAILTLERGIIRALQVGEEAPGCRIIVASATTIQFLELLAAAVVQGPGIVEDALIHADGSIFENPPLYVSAEGVDVGIGTVPTETEAIDEDGTPEQAVIIYKIDSLTLQPNRSADVPVTTSPVEDVTVTATSSNTTVATAEVNGTTVTLTALQPGTARITVLAGHPEYSAAGASFTVTVVLPKAATPTAVPAPGEVVPGTEIILTSVTPQAAIYYTTDGSLPTTASTLYGTSRPVVTADGLTLRAIAVKDGMAVSDVAVLTYTATQIDVDSQPDHETD